MDPDFGANVCIASNPNTTKPILKITDHRNPTKGGEAPKKFKINIKIKAKIRNSTANGQISNFSEDQTVHNNSLL